MISDEFDPYEEDYWRDIEPEPKCSTCKGTGIVNALTAPADGPFVASFDDCPHCDGTGYVQ